MILNSMWRPTR